MSLADISDVEARLGRTLTDAELSKVPGLLTEASVLVEGYCGQTFSDPAPAAVRVVVSRLAARALTAVQDSGQELSASQYSAGPFSWSQTFAGDGSRMWIGASDRMALKPFRIAMRSIELSSHDWG